MIICVLMNKDGRHESKKQLPRATKQRVLCDKDCYPGRRLNGSGSENFDGVAGRLPPSLVLALGLFPGSTDAAESLR